MDKFDCTNINAACRLPDEKQIGVALHLARQNQLLLVAARKVLGCQFRVWRTHIKAFDLALGVLNDRGVVHEGPALVGWVTMIAEYGIFPCGELHDQPLALAVFRHMGNPACAA